MTVGITSRSGRDARGRQPAESRGYSSAERAGMKRKATAAGGF